MKFKTKNILYIYKSIKNTELRLKMAFLLLLHQKMRLQRKQNQLTLKQLRYTSLVERMQKKVDKREKYYAKLEKQLERQANCYKNSANMFFSQQMGLGCNGVNLNNMYGSSMAAIQMLGQWGDKDPMGNPVKAEDIQIAQAMMAGQYQLSKDGKSYIFNINGSEQTYDKDAIEKGNYQKIMQMAQSQVTQAQTYATQCKSNYENNVSIWLEAQQEQLEAQKEWEMDMLAEEQADLEAEKTSVETQLELIKQEKQNIEGMLGQAIQDAAPKFGLP